MAADERREGKTCQRSTHDRADEKRRPTFWVLRVLLQNLPVRLNRLLVLAESLVCPSEVVEDRHLLAVDILALEPLTLDERVLEQILGRLKIAVEHG